MGGKSGGVTGYWYRVAYHHGIASTPIDAFLEFRCADKTAWSGEITASSLWHIEQRNLFGGESDQGGISSDVEILFGDADAQPSPYLATLGQYIANGDGSLLPYLQSIAGSSPPASPTGQVPGWRGVTTFIFRGGYYGANNPYPQKPSYKFRVIKKGWDNDTCWYPEKAEVVVTGAGSLPEGSTDWDYQVIDFSEPNTEWSNFTPPSDGWQSGGTMPFSTGTDQWPEMRSNLWVRKTVTVTGANQTLKCAADNGCVLFVNAAIVGYSNRNNDPVAHNENNPVAFPVAAGSTYQVMAKAYAEKSASDDSGNVLDITIEATGLTAMNPAHILYEALTAQDRGAEPIASINDASFRAAADWFYAQGIGLCTQLDPDSETVEQFRERICKVAGCGVSRSPVDGLWYLDIVNGVYDLDSLPILTDDDILDFSESPSTLDDAINSISVEYMDVQIKATVTTPPVQALALVTANGLNHDVRQYHELPTGGLGARFAQRDLQGGITPTRSFDLTTTRKPYGWRVNTYFRLQSAKRGIADMVCLLAEKSSGTLKSGAMKLTAAEDIYSLPAASFVQVETGVDPRPRQIPLPIMQQAVFEAPYFEVVRNLSRADLAALPSDVGYLMTVAQAPGVYRDYTIEVSTDGGTNYAAIGNGPWCPTALIVEGDPLTNGLRTDFTLASGTNLAGVLVGQAALWDVEICRVDAIDFAAATITLGRGCADTVPAAHAADSRIWFFDGFVGTDTTEYTDGESVDVELLTNSGSQQLDPSLATPLTLTFDQRWYLPYPPGNLQINGSRYPVAIGGSDALSLTWSHRDRVLQADQLMDTVQPDVGPEAGQTATLRIYGETDTLLRTEAALDAVAYAYATDDETTDSGGVLGDPWLNKVVALLHFDAADGSAAFTDVKGNAWSAVTAGAAISTTQAKFGTSCLWSNSGGIHCPALSIGGTATPWTIEFWFYRTASGTPASTQFLIGQDSQHGILISSNATYGLGFYSGAPGLPYKIYTGVYPAAGSWNFCVLQWDGTQTSLALNGTLIGQSAAQFAVAGGIYIGRNSSGQPYPDFVDDVRITNGVARYSGSFPVPAVAFASNAATGRLNGRIRFELESARDGITSLQHHDIVVRRAGYGFNYGMFYGGKA